jgi:hypothetical protein
MYTACMAVVQIRDVPDDIHEALRRQAELEGKSLNKYLLEELRRLARRNRNAEILRRPLTPGKRPTGEEIVAGIRAVRDFAAGQGASGDHH